MSTPDVLTQIERLEDELRDGCAWVTERAVKFERLTALRAEAQAAGIRPRRRPLVICPKCLDAVPLHGTTGVCRQCATEEQLARDLTDSPNRHPGESRIDASRRGIGR